MSPEKWQTLTLAQQMGNIGSEIARARHWEERRDLKEKERALERGFELMDLTLADPRWRKRLKELCRFREVMAAWFVNSREYDVHPKFLEEFCIQLNLR